LFSTVGNYFYPIVARLALHTRAQIRLFCLPEVVEPGSIKETQLAGAFKKLGLTPAADSIPICQRYNPVIPVRDSVLSQCILVTRIIRHNE
jgi:hypothetical protein